MSGEIRSIQHTNNLSNSLHFLDFPYDIYVEIFKRTSFKDLAALANSCKTFQAMISSLNFDFFKYVLTKAKIDLVNSYDRLPPPGRTYHFNSHVQQILCYLPPFISFSQPKGPAVLFMRSWFKDLKVKIQNDAVTLDSFKIALKLFRQELYPINNPLYNNSVGMRVSLKPRANLGYFCSSSSNYLMDECLADQKFIYNLPSELLGADTLVEVQEMSRRFESGELSGENLFDLDEFIDRCSTILRGLPQSRRMILKGISCKLLQHILQNYTGKIDPSMPCLAKFSQHYLCYAFENVDKEDHEALEKLTVFATYYKGHWHKFRNLHLENTFRIFFLAMRLCDITVSDLSNPLIDSKKLLAWIPEPVLLYIKERSDESIKKLSTSLFDACQNLNNKKESIDLKTVGDTLEFLRRIARTTPPTVVHLVLLKICFKDRHLAYKTLLNRGEGCKKAYEKFHPNILAYHLFSLLLPAMVLINDDQFSPEEKFHLKKALVSWIPEKYSTPDAFGDWLPIAKQMLEKLDFPPLFPCDIESVFAFLAQVRKEAAEDSLHV